MFLYKDLKKKDITKKPTKKKKTENTAPIQFFSGTHISCYTQPYYYWSVQDEGRIEEEVVGHYMRAELDPDDSYNGSATDSDVQEQLMKSLRRQYNITNSCDLVKGHLLNHDLGGLAIQANLFPISGNANKAHSRCIEEPLKKYLYSGNKCIYTVRAVNNNTVGDNVCKDDFFQCSIMDEDGKQLFRGEVVSNIETGEGGCDNFFQGGSEADTAFESRKKRWNHNFCGEKKQGWTLGNIPVDFENADQKTVDQKTVDQKIVDQRKAEIEGYYRENSELDEDMIWQLPPLYGIQKMLEYLKYKCLDEPEILFDIFMQIEFPYKCCMIEALPSDVGVKLIIASGLLDDEYNVDSIISLMNGLDYQYQAVLVEVLLCNMRDKTSDKINFANRWVKSLYQSMFSSLESWENNEMSLKQCEGEVLSEIEKLLVIKVKDFSSINPFDNILKHIYNMNQKIIEYRILSNKEPQVCGDYREQYSKIQSEILAEKEKRLSVLMKWYYAEREILDMEFNRDGNFEANKEYYQKQRELNREYGEEKKRIYEEFGSQMLKMQNMCNDWFNSQKDYINEIMEEKRRQLSALEEEYCRFLTDAFQELYCKLQDFNNSESLK